LECFEKLPADYEAKWGPAMNLGSAGREKIKGHDIAYYQDAIREAREKTLVEFAKKDDVWFTTALKEPVWGGPLFLVSRLRAHLAPRWTD